MTPAALLAPANVPAADLDRMTDDGGPLARATTPPLLIDDWYRQLGASHRRRHEVAGHESRSLQDREREQERAVRRRWPGIVAAIRTLTGRYNDGAGLDVLTVVDDADGKSRDLIVTVVARGGQTITMTASGAEVCVRPSAGTAGSPDDGRRWMTFGGSDEATAAYALQHWLTQL